MSRWSRLRDFLAAVVWLCPGELTRLSDQRCVHAHGELTNLGLGSGLQSYYCGQEHDCPVGLGACLTGAAHGAIFQAQDMGTGVVFARVDCRSVSQAEDMVAWLLNCPRYVFARDNSWGVPQTWDVVSQCLAGLRICLLGTVPGLFLRPGMQPHGFSAGTGACLLEVAE